MNAVFSLQRKCPPGDTAVSSSVAAAPVASSALGGASSDSDAASPCASPAHSQRSLPPLPERICVGMEIPASAGAFSKLVGLCKQAHSLAGPMLESDFHRKGKKSFTKEEANAFLNVSDDVYYEGTVKYKFLRRGHFYCGVKDCKWAVPFTFHSTPVSNARYQILQSSGKDNPVRFCLDHNHPPSAGTVASIDGKTLVSSEKDLRSEEVDEILRYATSYTDMPSMLLELRLKFRDREIHHEVIKRILRKERDRIFGTDRHRISDLQKRGAEIRANGGLFKETISPQTYRLGSVAMQTHTMKMYSIQYGSHFALMDGSHKTNKYGLQSIPCTTIDCLGKSVMLGLGCGLGESIVNCTGLGRDFGFAGSIADDHEPTDLANPVAKNSTKGVLMTDEGSFAAKTAANLNMLGLLCVKHKKTHIVEARAGLGDRAKQFVKDMNDLMFADVSVEELNSRFQTCKEKYGDVKSPSDFMTRFENIKEKTCYGIQKQREKQRPE